MKRRLIRVGFEQAKIPSRSPLNRFWKSLKVSPEAGNCSVPLKLFERTFFFGFKNFGNQEI